ncbi:unnamed protein product, partial [Brenthis ino]
MKENKRKCFKCDLSPVDDPETRLFRFPKPGSTNILRCELWAKYFCPDKPWSNKDFQMKLYTEHRMLCHRHFNETAFVDFPSKKLRRFASPDVKEITMSFLRDDNIREPVVGPSQPLVDISNRYLTTGDLLGPSGVNNINPVENKIFIKCKKYLHKVCLMKKQLKHLKNSKYLKKLSTSDAVKKLTDKISPNFALLLQAQIRNFKKSAKGRRWTEEDKITALRLYKRSPTCYRLLRRMFTLPAPTNLKVLLGKCKLNVGINKQMFEIVGKFCSTQEAVNNEYVLMFDEIALKKHLQYNNKNAIFLEGYQDHGGQSRTAQVVSNALVFMIAGIRKKIKQPMAYYLSGSSVTADRLAVLIKEVLEQCHEHGINIAASVCDMVGVNRRALCSLGATATFGGIQGTGVAKWSHIVKFYESDNSNPNFVFAPCLRQEHLNPNTKQKMRVKLAVQLLSHTVAAGMFAKIS